MKRFLSLHALVVVALAGALLAGLSRCTIQKKGEGANKKVDIDTPVGSLHVNTQVDPKDTGLAVYPGATRAEDEDRKHAANLSIDSSVFGAKVVAIKYRSDDPPDKLLDFYRKQLKSYGDVSECHGSISFDRGNMRCHETGLRGETNLVAGVEERHRIVSIKPEGKGSNFALVYVQTRGEKGTL
ncbi:MAG: hypothetical protein ACHP7P_01975 [Terriglobales bacterium]